MASTISTRVVDDNRSHYAESVDGPASEGQSRATSRLSPNFDHYSAMQHIPRQGVYTTHSSSSLSLAWNLRSRTRKLPPVPPSQGYSYTRGPSSTSSQTSFVQHNRVSQDEPPSPIPPIPASSYNSPQDSWPPISPIPVLSRRVTSPTSSIHSRSLLFSSHPSPAVNKTATPPVTVTHCAQLFQSGVPRPRTWRIDTSPPSPATVTIVHQSPTRIHP